MNEHSSNETFEYDIVLSFAGEDRAYVDQVAKLLQGKGVRIFYDEFAIAETWGADLYVFLDEVYRKSHALRPSLYLSIMPRSVGRPMSGKASKLGRSMS